MLRTGMLLPAGCLALCICGAVMVPPVQAQQSAELHELSAEQAAAINFAYGGGTFDYRYDDHCRAGFAQSVRTRAIPSNTRYYGGYYAGGGVPVLGEGRYPEEGTFGWDYLGLVPKRVALYWTHGRREQGHGGTYQTDGPKREHK